MDNKIRKWYNRIRRKYDISQSLIHSGERSRISYFNFLLLIHRMFVNENHSKDYEQIIAAYKEVKHKRRDYYFAKAIDEYNMTITSKRGKMKRSP